MQFVFVGRTLEVTRGKKNFASGMSFSLDSFARENYTFISCFMHVNATSMATSIGSAGKRNQGKASQ
jgi:hypothetical protein